MINFSYIARQPIVDRRQRVFGYELLFRDSEQNSFPNIDPDEATSRVLLQQHLIGDIDTVCLGKHAFINFHTNTLLHQFPSFLHKKSVFIEIIESVDVSDDLILACQQTKERGYRIALDDHDFHEKWNDLLPHTEMVKIDIQQQPLSSLRFRMKYFKKNKIKTLAERIETREQFEQCLELGFDYFQGYYFDRPEVVRRRVLAPQQLALLQLLAATNQPHIDFKFVAGVIKNDLSLTYSILRFVNSAAFNPGNTIEDIYHAVIYVGEAEMKRYVALLAFANIAREQPEDLVIRSLTRAYFMAELAKLSHNNANTSTCFMIGLLSLLDILLQTPMHQVLEKLPLSKNINQAILQKKGSAGRLLQVIEAYEAGDWRELDQHLHTLNIHHLDIGKSFVNASEQTKYLMDATELDTKKSF